MSPTAITSHTVGTMTLETQSRISLGRVTMSKVVFAKLGKGDLLTLFPLPEIARQQYFLRM